MKSSIIGSSGAPMIILGGPHMYKDRKIGQFVCEYSWINGEPSMVLYPAARVEKTGAYVINMNDAYKYVGSDGYATPTLMSDCIDAAKAMGFYDDKFACMQIADIILDGISDLINMPPEPQASETANAPTNGENELTIKLDGQTIVEAVV